MADLESVGPLEFVVVIRDSSTSFKYTVYLVPVGGDYRNVHARDYVNGADTFRGATRAIRKERRRRELGAKVVYREVL